MSNYLERYVAGERIEVWDELFSFGAEVRKGELWQEAQLVAHETMRRVRANLELIYSRLKEREYPFLGDICEPLEAPSADINEKLAFIEKKIGLMPLSIGEFYRTVGAVDFRGGYSLKNGYRVYHPEWKGLDYPDPIVFWPFDDDFLSEEYENWIENIKEYGQEEIGLFCWSFAPDDYHKQGVSGGPAYGIALPTAGVDAIVENEWHNTTFVDYLRQCFEWGGFPGFARQPRKVSTDLITFLSQGLLPI